MLQLQSLSIRAHEALAVDEPFPPWKEMADLERVTNDWVKRWFDKRAALASRSGLLTRAHESLDRLIRTDAVELLDNPDYPVAKKLKIVRGVHRFNAMYRTYPRYVQLLTPLIEEVARRKRRPARILELASGAGEMAMAICKVARLKNLPLKISGSDVIPEYVKRAGEKAHRRGLPIDFHVINAFEMHGLDDNQYDILVINGSTHHFTAGQVAMMIAQAKRVASTAFVSIDGVRSLSNILGPVPYPALTFQFGLLHDAWLSGRKFFSEYELRHISQIAVNGAKVSLESAFPMACLTVRFDHL